MYQIAVLTVKLFGSEGGMERATGTFNKRQYYEKVKHTLKKSF